MLCFYPVKILGSSLLIACMGEVILHWPPGLALIVTLSLGLKPHHVTLLFETLQKLPFPHLLRFKILPLHHSLV